MAKLIQLKDKDGYVYPIYKVYSTVEHQIGVWYDGKPVYGKLIRYYYDGQIGQQGQVTNLSIPHNIANFKYCIDARATNNGGYVMPALAGDGTKLTAGDLIIKVDSENIIFRMINDAWSKRSWCFWLEYTKTND